MSDYDDDGSFGEWFNGLLLNPVSGGAKGCFWYIVALPAMIICGVLGLTIFPSGIYPTIVLIIPGLILGAIVLSIYGWIAWRLPTILSVPLSIVLAIIGYYFAYHFITALFGQFLRAI